MPVPNSLMARAEAHTEWRRDFHRHPETAFEETRTARVIAERLRGFGCDQVTEGLAGTGTVAVIYGRDHDPAAPWDKERAILLRADIDALPMTEESGAPHASETPGRMHACGHDGHTTMLLAAAEYLAETRAFSGAVVLVFQPAEEFGGGAKKMIAEGLLERWPCRAGFALHAGPGVPVGGFATRPGPVCGANEDFEITLRAPGGHAAYPHQSPDVLLAAAHLTTALHGIGVRQIDPKEPTVLSVTSIQGGDSFNVLPSSVRIRGTVRCYDEAVLAQIVTRIEAAARGTAETAGCGLEIWRDPDGYPPLINDAGAVAFAREAAASVVGPDRVFECPAAMGVEDFAFIARAMPCAYLYVGMGEDSPMLHHPSFDFNDAALPIGAAFFVAVVERGLPLA